MEARLPFGFNLVGFATANLGHGVALRNTAVILEKARFPFCVLDIDPGGNRTGHDLSLSPFFIQAGCTPPHPVNLFHLNPPNLESLFRDLPDAAPTQGRFNVCVVFWELPQLPLSWIPMLRKMDLILCPSRFVQKAMEAAVPSAPKLYYPQSIRIPDARPDRSRWGLPDGKTVFLFSFDISSGLQRKDPLAVISAFRGAFPKGEAVLLIKINNRNLSADAATIVDKLKTIAAGVAGARVIDETMPYAQVMSLYASADVYVSLHRGEGLGLGMMESMALGKPVIGTGWSGNMDFMDETNSCLVPYKLVPVPEGIQYHAVSLGLKDLVWAEPSVEAAAKWMSLLDANPEVRLKIGSRAKESIIRFVGNAFEGRVFSEIQERYGRSLRR